MNKYIYILVALSMAPQFSIAQSIGAELDAELEQVVAASQPQPVQVAPAQAAAGNGQPIYILNQAPQTQTTQQVQKQPTTLIQSSPLTESRAEAIRRARQEAEVETEQKIVEKLESSRMEDEKRRAQALFGDKFDNLQQGAPQAGAQPVMAVAPVQEIDSTRDLVKEEIRAALDEEKSAIETPTETRYFGAILGISEVPDARNVRGNYSVGAAFGNKYNDAMIVEGSFMVSNYTVDTMAYNSFYSLYQVDVNQYSGALAAKYQLFSGMVRPVVGGLVQYSYRTFQWTDSYGNAYNDETASSHAVDVGAIVGADLEFSSKVSLGFDFRYMINMSSRTSGPNYNYYGGYQLGTPIEKMQYYVMGVVGRVTF